MLASDLNNPEFVNPMNPDKMLHVSFFWKEPVLKWQSEVKGKEVRGPRQAWVRLMRPGDNTSVFESAVREDHKARFPQEWLAWQIKEGMIEGALAVPGWALEEWDVLKGKDIINELRHKRFSTVEQLAGASDAQIQGLGIGGIGLREQARAAMRERYNAQSQDELAKRDKQIAELQAQMAELLAAQKPGTLTLPKGK